MYFMQFRGKIGFPNTKISRFLRPESVRDFCWCRAPRLATYILRLSGTVRLFHTVRVRYICTVRVCRVRFSVPYAYGCPVRVYLA